MVVEISQALSKGSTFFRPFTLAGVNGINGKMHVHGKFMPFPNNQYLKGIIPWNVSLCRSDDW